MASSNYYYSNSKNTLKFFKMPASNVCTLFNWTGIEIAKKFSSVYMLTSTAYNLPTGLDNIWMLNIWVPVSGDLLSHMLA